MNQTSLKCYLSYNSRILNLDSNKELASIIEAKIEEILNIKEDILFPLEKFGVLKAVVKLVDTTKLPKEHQLLLAKDKNLALKDSEKWLSKLMLEISIDVPVPDFVHEEYKKSIIEMDKDFFDNLSIIEFNRIHIALIFKKRIFDFVIATNLSFLGSLPLVKGVIFQEGESIVEVLEELNISQLYSASKFSVDIGYPILKNIEFLTVWNWIIKQEDFLTGFSSGSTGREKLI